MSNSETDRDHAHWRPLPTTDRDQQLQPSSSSLQLGSCRHRRSRPRHKLPVEEPIGGLAILSTDAPCVLRDRLTAAEIDILDPCTYKVSRCLPIFKLDSMDDMASCEKFACLYVSDPKAKCIHRLDLTRYDDHELNDETEAWQRITSWEVPERPHGLSVTSRHMVLVTCRDARKLLELSTDGNFLREISLDVELRHPRHAVQLRSSLPPSPVPPKDSRSKSSPSNDELLFAICHGQVGDVQHRVCLVDGRGRVVSSYDGRDSSSPRQTTSTPPRSDVLPMCSPFRLAVDDRCRRDGGGHRRDLIYVADLQQVLLLAVMASTRRPSWRLELLKTLTRYGLPDVPSRLCLDRSQRRLYVAINRFEDNRYTAGQVLVFDVPEGGGNENKDDDVRQTSKICRIM
jgi:hypothetical protein